MVILWYIQSAVPRSRPLKLLDTHLSEYRLIVKMFDKSDEFGSIMVIIIFFCFWFSFFRGIYFLLENWSSGGNAWIFMHFYYPHVDLFYWCFLLINAIICHFLYLSLDLSYGMNTQRTFFFLSSSFHFVFSRNFNKLNEIKKKRHSHLETLMRFAVCVIYDKQITHCHQKNQNPFSC